mmetsp:Transcript_2876/g.6783  ORF Transcript_2876/g.6783 Transcript_2876/m.6783 type:complete len:560 (+) Transcript_2876:2432-4111(+)
MHPGFRKECPHPLDSRAASRTAPALRSVLRCPVPRHPGRHLHDHVIVEDLLAPAGAAVVEGGRAGLGAGAMDGSAVEHGQHGGDFDVHRAHPGCECRGRWVLPQQCTHHRPTRNRSNLGAQKLHGLVHSQQEYLGPRLAFHPQPYRIVRPALAGVPRRRGVEGGGGSGGHSNLGPICDCHSVLGGADAHSERGRGEQTRLKRELHIPCEYPVCNRSRELNRPSEPRLTPRRDCHVALRPRKIQGGQHLHLHGHRAVRGGCGRGRVDVLAHRQALARHREPPAHAGGAHLPVSGQHLDLRPGQAAAALLLALLPGGIRRHPRHAACAGLRVRRCDGNCLVDHAVGQGEGGGDRLAGGVAPVLALVPLGFDGVRPGEGAGACWGNLDLGFDGEANLELRVNLHLQLLLGPAQTQISRRGLARACGRVADIGNQHQGGKAADVPRAQFHLKLRLALLHGQLHTRQLSARLLLRRRLHVAAHHHRSTPSKPLCHLGDARDLQQRRSRHGLTVGVDGADDSRHLQRIYTLHHHRLLWLIDGDFELGQYVLLDSYHTLRIHRARG